MIYLMPKSSKEAVVRLNARVQAIIDGRWPMPETLAQLRARLKRAGITPLRADVDLPDYFRGMVFPPPTVAIHAFLGWVK